MKSMMTLVFGLVIILFVSIACQSSPAPTARSVSVVGTTSSASGVGQPTLSAPPPSLATPTPDTVFVDESSCMDVCHVGEAIEQPAKPQPADHAGRTTCLSCHATLDKPVLPATHVGRMDVACGACHKENGVK